MRNLIKVSIVAYESQYGKIPLSDVMVMRKRNLIMGRKWRTLDVKMAVGMLAIFMCLSFLHHLPLHGVLFGLHFGVILYAEFVGGLFRIIIVP